MNIATKDQNLVIQGPEIESRYLRLQQEATYRFIINKFFVLDIFSDESLQ